MLDPWFKHTYPLKHLKKWLYWPWADYRVLRDAAAVLYTCEDEKMLARESFWLYRASEAISNLGTTAPTGCSEQQRGAFFEKYPELRGKRLALFMGRLHEKKGCDILLKAFAAALREPAWRLVIAGPDQNGVKAQLVKLSEQLRIADRVVWTGMVKGDIKDGAIEACEIFVLPSHQENFGIVVAEAMARGVPVLISNKVNIWREIEQDGAGLVGNDDVPATTELLERWNAMSDGEREAMRQRARASFNARFEITQAVRTLTATLQKVVESCQQGENAE
jgi:glycosyltransferase involved in cell wall biosynthesis